MTFFNHDNFFTQHVDVISVVVVVQLFYVSCPIAIQSYAELSKAIFDNLPAKTKPVPLYPEESRKAARKTRATWRP